MSALDASRAVVPRALSQANDRVFAAVPGAR